MTEAEVMNQLRDDLSHGAVDVSAFVACFYPRDIEAGRLLVQAHSAGRWRGQIDDRLVAFDGRVSGLAS
ncbi:MAG: hypothetical protein OXG16_07315 [Rhodospirillales bacterium]|nr:hypothetical protein [Rhodospirillales bacterium]